MRNDNHDKNDILNPFSPQQPAPPEYFADRKEDLEDFRKTAINSAKLKIPSPINYAIRGTWGQGKTSLLYRFRQMAIEELQREIKCVCIYFALSPESCQSWEKFTNDFLESVPSTVQSTHGIEQRIRNEVGKWEPSLNLGIVSATRKQRQQKIRLVDALQNLWRKHLAPSGVQIAFIMLDDLHYFPLRAEESAYLTLRTTFQELVNRKCNYSLVVTAPTLLFSEISEIAEPLGRFFKPIDLETFAFDDAKEAIQIRLKSVGGAVSVEDDVIQLLVQKTEGHPYLLMFTMYELLNLIGNKTIVDKDTFERFWPKIEELLGKQIFAQKFQHASPTERRLMINIAKKKSLLVSPSEFRKFKGVSRLFVRLEEKELLNRSERGRYSLFHPLFAEYLRRQ